MKLSDPRSTVSLSISPATCLREQSKKKTGVLEQLSPQTKSCKLKFRWHQLYGFSQLDTVDKDGTFKTIEMYFELCLCVVVMKT